MSQESYSIDHESTCLLCGVSYAYPGVAALKNGYSDPLGHWWIMHRQIVERIVQDYSPRDQTWPAMRYAINACIREGRLEEFRLLEAMGDVAV